MFRFLIFFCLFINISKIQAQERIHLNQQKLKTFTYDSLKNAFNRTKHQNPKLGKIYASAYYKKAVEKNDTKEIYTGAHQYALAYNILGQKDSALYFIDIALKESKNVNDNQQYASSLYLKGNIYYAATSYTKAIKNYTKAYEIIKKDNDSIKLAKIANSIALIKNQIGETKQALDLIKSNLLFYEKLNKNNDTRFRDLDYINTLLSISETYTNLAEDYQEDEKAYLDSATVYCLKGIDKSLSSNDNEAYNIFLTLQGIIKQLQGDFKGSIIDLKNAEEKIIDLKIVNKLPSLYFYQGKNFFRQNDIDTALSYFLKVDSTVKNNNIKSVLARENYILLAQCYEKKNDIKKALHYLKIFRNRNAQMDKIIRKSSENIFHKYDVPSLTNRIDQLVKDTKVQKGRALLLTKISFFLLGIIILGIVYYFKIRQKYKRRFEAIVEELNSAKEKTAKKEKLPKTKDYKISDKNVQKILDGLELFEREKMFLQSKCSINFLAKEINTNATYLSKTLQSHKGKKFVQYITDLRIDYALVQLKENKKFRAYDIKSIAMELGFNTSESFSKSFKKQTGIYPSFYIKKLNSIDN